jgi:ribosomal protein S14
MYRHLQTPLRRPSERLAALMSLSGFMDTRWPGIRVIGSPSNRPRAATRKRERCQRIGIGRKRIRFSLAASILRCRRSLWTVASVSDFLSSSRRGAEFAVSSPADRDGPRALRSARRAIDCPSQMRARIIGPGRTSTGQPGTNGSRSRLARICEPDWPHAVVRLFQLLHQNLRLASRRNVAEGNLAPS